jgi:hypothetical protein
MAPGYLGQRATTLPEKVNRVAERIRAGGSTGSEGDGGARQPPPERLDAATRSLLASPRIDGEGVDGEALATLAASLTPELVVWLWGAMVDAEVIGQEAARSTTVRADIGGKVIVTRLSDENQAYARRTPLELLVQGLATALIDPLPDEAKPHGLT